MQRLKYENYRGCKDIIIIDLHNGYSVIAIKLYNAKENNYTVEFRIKEKTIEEWELIEKAESVVFNANGRTINSAILKQVDTYLQTGFLDYYIQRYEYETKCFDIGNDILEEKRLHNVS